MRKVIRVLLGLLACTNVAYADTTPTSYDSTIRQNILQIDFDPKSDVFSILNCGQINRNNVRIEKAICEKLSGGKLLAPGSWRDSRIYPNRNR